MHWTGPRSYKRVVAVNRRSFLRIAGLAAAMPSLVLHAAESGKAIGLPDQTSPRGPAAPGKELSADLVIIGGGLGGCAAALAALRSGLRVIMTEETDWLGGQLTSQAVPPDENPWIETFGGTRSYLNLRQRIREYYHRNLPLTAEARPQPFLNPGNGWVSRLCHEPRVAVAVLNELFAPYFAGQRLRLFMRHKPTSAQSAGDHVQAVQVQSLSTGAALVLRAPCFVDATELGDLLPLSGTEYVTGAESKKATGEPHAPEVAAPHDMQSFTCCFAIDYLEGEDHTISKPETYAFWREYRPSIKPAWPGRLLAWEYADPVTGAAKKLETDPARASGLWAYRRIADKANFVAGTYPGDISLVNWPQNDYMLGNLCEVSTPEAARHLLAAKQLSLSLLYWLQTEAPRPDGGTGWKGLRLRGDVVDTDDGLAKHPYIRESRRIQAEFTVLEQHVSTEFRMQETGATQAEVKAQEFKDSVGIGSYRIDLHPTTGGGNYLDVSSLPFQIPLGALLPRRMENLLAACKNLGVTHITNGCYRLHPVEWNIGEAAGALAAFALQKKVRLRQVRSNGELLSAFQKTLVDQGVPLSWPKATPR